MKSYAVAATEAAPSLRSFGASISVTIPTLPFSRLASIFAPLPKDDFSTSYLSQEAGSIFMLLLRVGHYLVSGLSFAGRRQAEKKLFPSGSLWGLVIAA